jgi:hypothetical protein
LQASSAATPQNNCLTRNSTKDFGYNEQADRDNEQAINDYLDAWRGSVSEEEAFAKLGITQSY